MLKLALLRLKTARALSHQLRLERERADRLEIDTRRQQLRLDELSADLTRLSERVASIGGRLGGRPPRVQETGPAALAAIPHGDKAQLRLAMGVTKLHSKE